MIIIIISRMNRIIFPSIIVTTGVLIAFNYYLQSTYAASRSTNTCVADIDDGLAIGLNDIGVTGMRMCVFYGIPYSKPPIGALRFENPEPIQLKGTKNFVQKPDKCPQLVTFDEHQDEIVEGNEDCLYLNVYRPLKVAKNKLLPVFFWIHGGSFNVGSFDSDINGFDYIVQQEIIVVAINYRLGPFGFLSLPALNITGNMGLKDQQLALSWVSKNIKNFGGDPNRITLVGWSAGAASVTFHMNNKKSQALFQQAIVMSGTMLDPWAFTHHAEFCGKNYLDYVAPLETKEELQAIEFLELMPRYLESLMFVYFGMHHFCFVPTIEPDWVDNKFFTAMDVIKIAKIPTLIGNTVLESATMYFGFDDKMINLNFPNVNESIIASIQEYIQTYAEARHNNAADRNLFLIKFASMADSFYGTRNFMDNIASNAPVYGYQFSFEGRFGSFKQNSNKQWAWMKGAVHGDDLNYLFVPFYESGWGENVDKEINTARQIVEMWTNFVKYGNPTPVTNKIVSTKWKPCNSLTKEIMNINSTLEMMKIQDTEEYLLWYKIYDCLYKWKCNFLENNPIEFIHHRL